MTYKTVRSKVRCYVLVIWYWSRHIFKVNVKLLEKFVTDFDIEIGIGLLNTEVKLRFMPIMEGFLIIQMV